jgi:hypothetical protein
MRRTTEHDTSPSFHWWPASAAVMVTYPERMVEKPQMRSQLRVFILCGIEDEPVCPS